MLSPIVDPVVQSGTLLIEHREPTFECQMSIVMDGKPFDTKYELQTNSGVGTDTSLVWDGNALVANWQFDTSNGQMTISFRYELSSDGCRLTATERLRGAGRDQDNTWVFGR